MFITQRKIPLISIYYCTKRFSDMQVGNEKLSGIIIGLLESFFSEIMNFNIGLSKMYGNLLVKPKMLNIKIKSLK